MVISMMGLCNLGGCLELVGFRHCRLGDLAAEAVADLIRSSRTIVESKRLKQTGLLFHIHSIFAMPLKPSFLLCRWKGEHVQGFALQLGLVRQA